MSWRRVWAACVLSSLTLASGGWSAEYGDLIGIYHWGGQRISSMSEGVDRIAALGSHVARVAYSPRYVSEYGGGTGCYPHFSLSSLAKEPDVERALDDARIRVFMLTAYDGVTFGDCQTLKYLNPRFFTPENVALIEAEYSDFVIHLFTRYARSGRRFILSNWESDNAVYCGSAYSYAIDSKFRTRCDLNYPVYYDGNSSPIDSLEGLRLWLQSRDDGLRHGIARAASLGLSGVEVLHAPEISIVQTLEDHGYRSVLRDVLPSLRLKYISYSAWESINRAVPGDALSRDIETIRALTGAAGVIVGEAGFSRSAWGDAAPTRLESVVRAALLARPDYFIYWNLNDQDPRDNFGAFDTSGRLTPCGSRLKTLLAHRAGDRERHR